MKILTSFKRIIGTTLALAIFATASLVPATPVSAEVYTPGGTPTSKTPIFNHFTGVPGSVGNEADFVRVRPKASTTTNDYVNNLASACNTNDSFTVRTYIHNGADPAYNTLENGVAIAKNTVVRMNAALNSTNSTFEFKSSVSSSNAAMVSDNAFLTCNNGKRVKMTLVEKSVQTYSQTLGYQGAPDTAVNGSLTIGSRVQGSGDVYACWDDRVTVTYDVKVEEVPVTQPSLGECKLLTVKATDKRRVSANITGDTNNATIVGYRIDWGDGTAVTEQQNANHEYAQAGNYTIIASVLVKYADGRQEWKNGDGCKVPLTVTPDTPPTVTPPPSTPPATPPTLPATGPAGIAALVALVSGISSIGYYFVTGRRASL